MNRNEIKIHLQYKWWAYLLAAVFIIGAWLAIFGILAKPKDNEKIGITFFGTDFNHDEMTSDLPDIIRSRTNQEIKQATAESIVESSEYKIMTIITTRTLGESDIIIWSGELKDSFPDLFAQLDEEIIGKVIDGVSYCRTESGAAYGIKLNGDNNFKKYYSGDEDCYLFVSAQSKNFGGANGKGGTKNDAALQVVKYLLGAA